jgi:hypothetical protein
MKPEVVESSFPLSISAVFWMSGATLYLIDCTVKIGSSLETSSESCILKRRQIGDSPAT